jgi:hypothetical protein
LITPKPVVAKEYCLAGVLFTTGFAPLFLPFALGVITARLDARVYSVPLEYSAKVLLENCISGGTGMVSHQGKRSGV